VKLSARYRAGHVFREKKKQGPDKWFLRIKDDSGKKKKILLGTVEQLKTRRDALKAAEHHRLKANPDNPFSQGVSFGALLDRYVADEMPKRWSTQDSYGAWIRAYIKPKWGEYPVSKVEPYNVEQWLAGLELAPKSKGHIKNLMLIMFNCAMRWKLVPMGLNPMSLVRVPGSSKRLTASRVLSADEVIRLISHIEREPFRTAAWLSVCLGLEPSVLFALQWQDVNFDEMSVGIKRGIVCNHVGETKNEYRGVPLPLDGKLCGMLAAWKRVSEYQGG
jgi:integrase